MTLKQRISAFSRLGAFINEHYSGSGKASEAQLHQGLKKVIEVAGTYNNWFIPDFVHEALRNIGSYLNVSELETFTERVRPVQPKTVAVICAGNIPMVGFHDILCVLLSGHKTLIKMSSDDNVLLPFFLKLLVHYDPEIEEQILFASGKLTGFDAVIATGSDNTASHMHYYFGKYPNIIRKSRTSLAVLDGSETSDELKALGRDMFLYFGLGCRNVSKLLVPPGYNFNQLFEAIVDWGFVVNNKKYGNNYDYHRAIYLLESIRFLDNNFVMVRESQDLHSPVGVVYYQHCSDKDAITGYIKAHSDHIQCIVGHGYIPFGYSQQPVISDFADNTDTLHFLLHL